MFEVIKKKIWEILKEKSVSLAMVFDRDGRILWHHGREIAGNTIEKGQGFSKSYIRKCLESGKHIHRENVVMTSSKDHLPESAFRLVLKCVIIYPIENDLFLYVDSGKKESFAPNELETFKMLGDMLAETVRRIRREQDTRDEIGGSSEAMQKIKKLVLAYSLADEPILLKGETGVGKNHLAEQVHLSSGRRGKFMVVHTPSINENLFESEIFGHKKGSFTDAKYDQKGLAAAADGGTLFFDEISEIPLTFQAKLLRFIETKKYRILGETCEREANVRIITATNRNLMEAIDNGEFREDLYFRLHVLEIEIPPLRERNEDIKALVMKNEHHLMGKEPGKGFWEVILDHHWPGNVRELITVLKRAGIMLESPITGEDLLSIIQMGIHSKSTLSGADKEEQAWNEIQTGVCFWDGLWSQFIAREVDRHFVKKILKKAYLASNNSFRQMIDTLNIPPGDYQKFMSLMYKYKIDPRIP